MNISPYVFPGINWDATVRQQRRFESQDELEAHIESCIGTSMAVLRRRNNTSEYVIRRAVIYYWLYTKLDYTQIRISEFLGFDRSVISYHLAKVKFWVEQGVLDEEYVELLNRLNRY